jgi:hypothetical protein
MKGSLMRSLNRLEICECVPIRRAGVGLILHDLGDLWRRKWRHIHLDGIKEIVLSRPRTLQGLFFLVTWVMFCILRD